jgi:hypothetical protein
LPFEEAVAAALETEPEPDEEKPFGRRKERADDASEEYDQK